MDSGNDRARRAYEAGRALLESGDLAGAIVQFERSVAEYPHFKTLELLGEALLRQGEPLRALVPLAAATTLNKQGRAPSLLAEALVAVGEPIQAHSVAQLALVRDPQNRRALAVRDSTLAEYRQWSGEQ